MVRKLTNEIKEKLLLAREQGLNQVKYAGHANIPPSILEYWLRKGKKAKKGKYREFYLEWNKRDSKRELYLNNLAQKEAQKGNIRAIEILFNRMNKNEEKDNLRNKEWELTNNNDNVSSFVDCIKDKEYIKQELNKIMEMEEKIAREETKSRHDGDN